MISAVRVHQQLPPVSGDRQVRPRDLGQTEVWTHVHIYIVLDGNACQGEDDDCDVGDSFK